VGDARRIARRMGVTYPLQYVVASRHYVVLGSRHRASVTGARRPVTGDRAPNFALNSMRYVRD
jgi:hypothetical protein